jgi:hypothetical protein
MNNTIEKTKHDFVVLHGKRELCISCGVETEIPVNTPIDFRKNYVEGCGQLCPDCFIRIYGK